MKHFGAEEWIDFVNQAVSPRKKQEMDKHLLGGCHGCSKTVSAWEAVRRAAKTETNYQPPTGQVRIAAAAFAASLYGVGQKRAKGAIEVLFDSFLHPVFEGTRSSNTGTRQMLYRADPFQIDLQLESQPGVGVVVTGQLLNFSHPELVGCNVPVVLSNMHGVVVRTVTNQFGEFRGAIKTSGELELVFLGANDKPVVISILDAFGDSGDDKP